MRHRYNNWIFSFEQAGIRLAASMCHDWVACCWQAKNRCVYFVQAELLGKSQERKEKTTKSFENHHHKELWIVAKNSFENLSSHGCVMGQEYCSYSSVSFKKEKRNGHSFNYNSLTMWDLNYTMYLTSYWIWTVSPSLLRPVVKLLKQHNLDPEPGRVRVNKVTMQLT